MRRFTVAMALAAALLATTSPRIEAQGGPLPPDPGGNMTCFDPFFPMFANCVTAQIMQPGTVCVTAYQFQTYGAKCGPRSFPPTVVTCRGTLSLEWVFWLCVKARLDIGQTCSVWANPRTGALFASCHRPKGS